MTIERCPVGHLFCYAASAQVAAILTWLGFVLTIGGLGIALWQISKVAKSADAAATAIAGLKVHLDGVNLAYVNAQLNTVAIVTRSSDFILGQSLFSPIKRSIRLQAHAMGSSSIEMEGLNRAMGVIDKHLEWGRSGGAKYSATVIQRSLDELIGIVTAWEGRIELIAREK